MSPADLALIGVDAAQITSIYIRSFSWVISAWAAGLVVGIAIQLIKKV
jgi:hypothetical protein